MKLIFFVMGLLSFWVILDRYYWGLVLPRIKKMWGRNKNAKENILSALSDPQRVWPKVVVIIPCFNEGEGIYHTIKNILQSNYPAAFLQVVVMDDCSKDDSYQWALQAQRELAQWPQQVMLERNPVNIGKRKSIHRGLALTTSPFVISIDSDVIVDAQAIKILLASFACQEIAAVGGKVKVLNLQQNWITKMQHIKYYFGYEFLKGLENAEQQVLCLSGCLTAYRRSVLDEVAPIVDNRNVLGVPIKYGEDRFLTRQIVKAGHRTILNLDAVCYTIAPPTVQGYFKQQLRWRRSNFIDFLGGLSHIHKMRPLVAIHYLAMAALQISYPVLILIHIYYERFFIMLLLHMGILLLLCFFYLIDHQYSPLSEKVNPLWFLSMGVLMPVTYLFLSPLALWTLDSGSWETRNK